MSATTTSAPGLAVRSVRARGAATGSVAVSAFLGVTVILAFASLLDTAAGPGVSAADDEALVTMASIVGSWGLVIVVFSMVSITGVVVRQRTAELTTLRSVGMTPRQVRGLVRRETAVVTAVAGAAGALPGWAAGRGLYLLLRAGGVVSDGPDHRLSPVTAVAVVGAVVAVSVLAAGPAARTATRGSVRTAAVAAGPDGSRLPPLATAVALVLVAGGATASALTFVIDDPADPYATMQVAGPASIAWSIGLGLLSPVALRAAGAVLETVLRWLPARTPNLVPTSLAASHARRRARRTGAVLVPLVVFIGTATGTLYLMAIDADVRGDAVDEVVRLLNFVVVGMIAAFAAIMVVNAVVAAVADRRRELARMRLLGAVRGDVVSVVVTESVLLLAVGTVLGLVGSLGTIVPYALAETDSPVPAGGPWPLAGVLVVAATVSIGSAYACARRAVRTPPLAAVAP